MDGLVNLDGVRDRRGRDSGRVLSTAVRLPSIAFAVSKSCLFRGNRKNIRHKHSARGKEVWEQIVRMSPTTPRYSPQRQPAP